MRKEPLRSQDRPLVMDQIRKLREQRSDAVEGYDREIARLQRILDTGLIPQTCEA